MYFCLRVDVDYVPWDSPDAAEFGHGEPAVLLRLIELANSRRVRFHFFASNRVLRTFPTTAEAILASEHALDWFCKHPLGFEARYAEARQLFSQFGHSAAGISVKGSWPEGAIKELPLELRFISSGPGLVPTGLVHFPVDVRSDRDASRSGSSVRRWTDSVKMHMRQVASVNRGETLVVRPQVLAKFDPHLAHIEEIVSFADAIGLQVQTLRDLLGTPA